MTRTKQGLDRPMVMTYLKPSPQRAATSSTPAKTAAYLGGLRLGYDYGEFFIVAESIHQEVGFAGYPIGGISMSVALFGSVEALCKGQRPHEGGENS